jgi:peptidylprolyl isomerase
MKEQELLHDFLDSIKVRFISKQKGIYLIEQESGQGKVPTVNQEVTIHYEGFFLNGKKFDSTHDRNEPFTYVVGEQGQVVPGIERAILQMRKGGKATIIIVTIYKITVPLFF